jgi:hypothetical protein
VSSPPWFSFSVPFCLFFPFSFSIGFCCLQTKRPAPLRPGFFSG